MLVSHSRRAFFAYSAQALSALPSVFSGNWAFAADATGFPILPELKHLRPQDQTILAVLLPAALGVKFDKNDPRDQELFAQTLRALDHIIDQLSERNRQDLQLLLLLMSVPLTRVLMGLWKTWEKATQEEVLRFLTEWEQSVLSLQRFGYQSLMQIMEFAFYGVPGNSLRSSYPGVPSSIQAFLSRFQSGGG